MGNCVKKQSPVMQSDRGLPVKSPEEMFISGSQVQIKGDRSSGHSFTPTTEVKIKISKKQLEELLGRTDVQGLTVEQVLFQLMNVSDRFESHQRSWRPALQSIPE